MGFLYLYINIKIIVEKIFTFLDLKLAINDCKSLAAYVKIVNKNDKLKYEIINETNFLNKDSSISKRLYHIKNNITEHKKCPVCGKFLKWNNKYNKYNICSNKICSHILNPEKEIERRNKIIESHKNRSVEEKEISLNKLKKTCLLKYGVDSYAKTNEFKQNMLQNYGYISAFELKETREKSINTLIKRTGYDHNFKIPEVQNKRTKNFIKKYGFNTPTKNLEIKEKAKNTCLEKYGEISFSKTSGYTEKCIKTSVQKFGKNYYTQTQEYKDRCKKTSIEKYGYSHWMHNTEMHDNLICILNKTSKYKNYVLPNGDNVYLQGYEDYVLENILLKKYNLDDILIRNKNILDITENIYYIYNNSQHKYYPDFYIKSQNLIVEVKSIYTYEKDLEINTLKKKACLDKKLNFEFIIVDKKDYKIWKKQKQKKIKYNEI